MEENEKQICRWYLYVTRTGCQWRNIDHIYVEHLPIIVGREMEFGSKYSLTFRVQNGDDSQPSRLALDSQSVKSVPFVSLDKGKDGNKLINGRKRHIAWVTTSHCGDICQYP